MDSPATALSDRLPPKTPTLTPTCQLPASQSLKLATAGGPVCARHSCSFPLRFSHFVTRQHLSSRRAPGTLASAHSAERAIFARIVWSAAALRLKPMNKNRAPCLVAIAASSLHPAGSPGPRIYAVAVNACARVLRLVFFLSCSFRDASLSIARIALASSGGREIPRRSSPMGTFQ